jgi:hypothetical protein
MLEKAPYMWALAIQLFVWVPIAVCFGTAAISWIFGFDILASAGIAIMATFACLFVYRQRQ